jgi:hypothetical protein
MNATSSKEVKRVSPVNVLIREIDRWLTLCLNPRGEDEGRFDRLVCRHLVKGNKQGEEVFRINVPEGASDKWATSGATDIYNRLQREASTLGGLQKWAIYAYADSDFNNHFSRHLIRIQGTESEDESSLDSEGPDKSGLTSQAMRHTEAAIKLLVSGAATVQQSMQNMLDRQSTLIENLFEQRVETLTEMTEMLERREEKELINKRETAKIDAIKDLAGKGSLLLPAIINKIAGSQILPVPQNGVMLMAKSLMTSIASSEEKLLAMSKILSPEEMAAFINLYESVSKDDSAGAKKE